MVEKFSQHIQIHGGRLFNWHARDATEVRRREVRKAVEHHGYAKTIEELNLLHTFDKDKHPKVAEAAQADLHWLQRERADGATWTE